MYPNTRGRDTLVLSCPHCVGLPGFGLHVFLEFSFISEFRFSCQSVLLINSCFPSQIFLITHRSESSIEFQLSSRPTDTRCALANILTNDLACCFLFSPMRPSAHFVARGRGKPRSQATVGAGLRIGHSFLASLLFFLDLIFFRHIAFCGFSLL